MKILEAFGEPIADGGQEAFVFNVLEKMDMTGMTIDCLTAYNCESEKYKSLVEHLGGNVYALNLPFTPGKSRGNIRKPLRKFLKRHPYDVIHIHSGSISVLAIMSAVADKAGVKKVIVHSHVDGEQDNFRHKILRFLASVPMSRHVDTYCACSSKAAEWKFQPSFARKARIIKNGIDTERFRYKPEERKRAREQLNFSDCFVIGHVGRFDYQKNHAFLISLFDALSRKDDSARLLLVGDGGEKATIKKLVSDKGLTDKVIFTGSVTNVDHYLQAMDVFVLPSRFEGLGIVAIEAQCAGLPVVASEAIPSEAVIADVRFLSLSEKKENWVRAVVNYRNYNRQDNSAKVRKAGFDARNTARSIRRMYMLRGKQ